jgi:hypothetical protein
VCFFLFLGDGKGGAEVGEFLFFFFLFSFSFFFFFAVSCAVPAWCGRSKSALTRPGPDSDRRETTTPPPLFTTWYVLEVGGDW